MSYKFTTVKEQADFLKKLTAGAFLSLSRYGHNIQDYSVVCSAFQNCANVQIIDGQGTKIAQVYYQHHTSVLESSTDIPFANPLEIIKAETVELEVENKFLKEAYNYAMELVAEVEPILLNAKEYNDFTELVNTTINLTKILNNTHTEILESMYPIIECEKEEVTSDINGDVHCYPLTLKFHKAFENCNINFPIGVLYTREKLSLRAQEVICSMIVVEVVQSFNSGRS